MKPIHHLLYRGSAYSVDLSSPVESAETVKSPILACYRGASYWIRRSTELGSSHPVSLLFRGAHYLK
ncbi:MAG: DUF4278 domain-containing protein [Synechococcales cyanobacterium M58_A2018_015]|nr:DUF4278 domain-containing protein [Synechococcales cyanobacterium M58_A2018_015]